jgi:hypothetical protein
MKRQNLAAHLLQARHGAGFKLVFNRDFLTQTSRQLATYYTPLE